MNLIPEQLPVLLAGALLLLMQAGFALVTTGLCRARNAGQIVAANVMIFITAVLGFRLCGFAIVFGFSKHAPPGVLLQMALLVSIAAVIPAGAMAERWSFRNLVWYGFFAGGVVVPLLARWIWNNGWMARLPLGHGVVDFAGSGVIHLSGGVSALMGALLLGPRAGKYARDGRPKPMPGHNLVFVCVGVFVLFAGWFGFNSAEGVGDQMGAIVLNTLLAGAAGAFAAYVTTVAKFGKPDPSMICNGILAGLVSSCASCAYIESIAALIIGAVAGVLVVYSVLLFEGKFKIDDPVGAISVHGVAGAWGMLATGLFASDPEVCGAFGKLFHGPRNDWEQLAAQCVGVLVCGALAAALAAVWFKISNAVTPLRTRRDVEVGGLDLPETGAECYPDFHLTDKTLGGDRP